jgi:hypothetical protein
MDVFKKFFGEGIYGAGTVGGTLLGADEDRKKVEDKLVISPMGISPLNIFETVEILEVKGFVVE